MTARERGEPICVGDALRLTRDLDGDSWIVERAFRPEATTLPYSKAAFDESSPRLVYDLDWREAVEAMKAGATVESSNIPTDAADHRRFRLRDAVFVEVFRGRDCGVDELRESDFDALYRVVPEGE